MCIFNIMAAWLISGLVFPQCYEPAVFLTGLDVEASEEHGSTCRPVLSAFWRGLWGSRPSSSLVSAAEWGAANVPSCICLTSCRSRFFFSILHTLVSRLPFVWNVSGSSFPFPDSWSELLAVWRSGRRGRRRWFNSHVTLSAWQRCRGASGEGFTHTHTHRTHCAYTSTYRSTHRQDPVHAQSHMYVCRALTHTHFFHLHWRLSPDTLVQRHLNRVQQQNEPQFKSLKWGMWNVLPHYPDHQRNNTQPTQGSLK